MWHPDCTLLATLGLGITRARPRLSAGGHGKKWMSNDACSRIKKENKFVEIHQRSAVDAGTSVQIYLWTETIQMYRTTNQVLIFSMLSID